MISRLFPEGRRVTRDVETLAEHIFEFSLAGLNAIKNRASTRAPHKNRTRTTLSL